MTTSSVPVLAPLTLLGLAVLAPLLARLFGRNAGYLLGAGFAGVAAALLAQVGAIAGGETLRWSRPWMPSLGIDLTLSIDGLSLLFAVLITAVGALVMAYSARYLSDGGARMYALLCLFAASMLTLVLAGDFVLLFVAWEMTTISSFFLIGGKGDAEAAKGAFRAFTVTALGGLALFAAIVLLNVATGSFDIATVVDAGDTIRASGLAPAIMVLLLLGAFTKSAQVPFHFWLPGAMVAPTPVSTYLHAATMVKAGIYLLARVSPMFVGDRWWTVTVVVVGLVTAVYASVLALRQYDLKALLAYSTVSQLGLLTALVGLGTYAALAAAAIHIIAHAAYKATLFMVVGIVDHETGTRDIRELSGLRRAMPITTAITGVAALSMVGLPPFIGFVSKEEAFGAFLGAPVVALAWFASGAAVLITMLTLAYAGRMLEGTFGGSLNSDAHEPPRSFVAPAAITAVAGLVFGAMLPAFDPLMNRIVFDTIRERAEVHLVLWHGLSGALWLSIVGIAAGVALYAARARVSAAMERVRAPVTGVGAFDATYAAALRAGKKIGAPFMTWVPAAHFAWILAAVVAATVGAWWIVRDRLTGAPTPIASEDWIVAGFIAVAVVGATIVRNRIAAIALLGTAGFSVAALYVVLGAPDLALTQLLVETLTIVVVVLVFRRLPAVFRAVGRGRRMAAAAAAAAMGAIAAAGTYVFTGRRPLSEIGEYYQQAAYEEAGGRNVVNTILVDFRALDTLGEITVIAVAALGIVTLVNIGRMRR